MMRTPLPFLALALALIWLGLFAVGGARFGPDQALLGLLHARERPALAQAARVVTELGGWRVLAAVTAVAALWLLRRGERRRAALLVAFTAGGRALVEIAKWLGGRPRPDELDQLVTVHSMSFPSGHAANSGITYAAVALLLFPRRSRALFLAAALSLAIGLSRIVLGVHWPTDVVAGWLMAILSALFLHRLVGAEGTRRDVPSLPPREGETIMSDNNRADTARRNDDSDLIDEMEEAPGFGGASGGNLQRDIASRAEEQHDADGKPGVTRVQDKDKPDEADLPRYNES